MSMQSEAANAFARRIAGGLVDPLAPPAQTIASGMVVSSPGVDLPGRGGRMLQEFAEELGGALQLCPLFRRENEVVTVDSETGELRIMTPERFISWIEPYVRCMEPVEVGRGSQRRVERYPRTMPLALARTCLQSDQFNAKLRRLSRVNHVRMPVMRCERPELLPVGYDANTQTLTLESEITINEQMTIDAARGVFDSYLGEFGFTDARSKAVAITMALALFGIAMQPIEARRMGFIVRSNSPGSGKSLIAQMAIIPPFGLPESTPKGNDDELRKVLDTVALQGVPYLFFDNLKGHFENELVENLLTTPGWRARVMGTQRFMHAKIGCVLIVTGNNLTISPDLQRRLLQCDLFVQEFDLQERQHARELNPQVLNTPDVRSEFLSAMWAFVRHWYEAGRPFAGAPGTPYRVATFADWSDIFGGIVQCAGYGNPLERPKDEEISSHAVSHTKRLIELLSADFSEVKSRAEYSFQDLIDTCYENDLFTWRLKGRHRNEDGEQWFEATPECASLMGLMFTNEMGRKVFALGGRRILFTKVGEGRTKRYVVEVVPARRAAVAA